MHAATTAAMTFEQHTCMHSRLDEHFTICQGHKAH